MILITTVTFSFLLQFRSVVSLLHPDCDIQGKLDVLAGKGFSKEQASSLVTQCPSLLCHDTATEFIPKLE